MLNYFSRRFFTALLCVAIAFSHNIATGTLAVAQQDQPPPKALPAEKAFPPEAPSDPATDAGVQPISQPASQPIPATPEIDPSQVVREILAKGRAILYPGHVLTPTEIVAAAESPSPARRQSSPNSPESTQASVLISGTVIVSDTGLPLNFVRLVGYFNGYPSPIPLSMTDRNGRFRFYAYSNEEMYIRVDPSQVYPYDLAGEWYDNQPLSSTAVLISVTPEGATDLSLPLSIVLERGAQITGTVVASDTGAPLANMTVAAYDANGTFLHSVLTDEAGRYATSGLSSGVYRLCATAYVETDANAPQPYPGTCYDQKPTPNLATPLTVTAPNSLPNITIAVPRASQITGVVTARDTGAPLAGVEVVAVSKGSNFGVYTSTNAAGQYALQGLRNDAYVIYFKERYDSSTSNWYLSEFYNDKRTFTTADLITLTGSVVMSNVNAALDVGGRITGVVYAQDTGKPLSGVQVFLFNSLKDYVDENFTDSTGAYRFDELEAGRYKVFFSARPLVSSGASLQYSDQFYGNTFTWDTALSIAVNFNETTGNINALLDKSGQITGKVTTGDTNQPLAQVSVIADRYGLTDIPSYADSFYSATRTDARGQYTITAPGGPVKVTFLPYYHLTPYCGQHYNQRPTYMRADTIWVQPGQMTPNINARLNRASHINGIISSAENNAPLSDVWAYLLPIDWLDNEFVYAASYDVSDALGRYKFGPVCAGSYKLYFQPINSISPTQELAPEYYNQKPTFPEGDEITLAAGVTRTIHVGLRRIAQITGTLHSADTGSPVPYTYIDVFDVNGRLMKHGSSDADGSYVLTLPAGRYKLRTDHRPTENFADGFYAGASVTSGLNEALTIVLTPTQVLSNVNFALQRGGVITGQVTDEETGQPIRDAVLRIYDAANPSFMTGFAFTNHAGQFIVRHRQNTGNYKVLATHTRYVSKYFGGQVEFGSGSIISVTSPLTTTNINISLLPITSTKMSTRLHLPISLRPAPELILIEPTPITLGTATAIGTPRPTSTPWPGATPVPTSTPS